MNLQNPSSYLEQPGLEVGVDEDIVAVQLEAVLIVDDSFLHRQQRSDKEKRRRKTQRWNIFLNKLGQQK